MSEVEIQPLDALLFAKDPARIFEYSVCKCVRIYLMQSKQTKSYLDDCIALNRISG